MPGNREKGCLSKTPRRFIDCAASMNSRRLMYTLYLAFFLGLGVAAGIFFLDASAEYSRLKRAEASSRQRLADAETRLREQQRILYRLQNDPDYLEQVIRRKLGYVQPDQYIFRFED